MRAVTAERATQRGPKPVPERDRQPVQRLDLAPHDRLEPRRAARERLSIGRNRDAGERTDRPRCRPSRRTARPQRRRCRIQRGSSRPNRDRRPVRPGVREMEPVRARLEALDGVLGHARKGIGPAAGTAGDPRNAAWHERPQPARGAEAAPANVSCRRDPDDSRLDAERGKRTAIGADDIEDHQIVAWRSRRNEAEIHGDGRCRAPSRAAGQWRRRPCSRRCSAIRARPTAPRALRAPRRRSPPVRSLARRPDGPTPRPEIRRRRPTARTGGPSSRSPSEPRCTSRSPARSRGRRVRGRAPVLPRRTPARRIGEGSRRVGRGLGSPGRGPARTSRRSTVALRSRARRARPGPPRARGPGPSAVPRLRPFRLASTVAPTRVADPPEIPAPSARVGWPSRIRDRNIEAVPPRRDQQLAREGRRRGARDRQLEVGDRRRRWASPQGRDPRRSRRAARATARRPARPAADPRRPAEHLTLVSFGRATSERMNPESTCSGSIHATAPFVRALANVRKWSFRFGARRQIDRSPACQDRRHVVGRGEVGVGDHRPRAGREEAGGVVVDPLLGHIERPLRQTRLGVPAGVAEMAEDHDRVGRELELSGDPASPKYWCASAAPRLRVQPEAVLGRRKTARRGRCSASHCRGPDRRRPTPPPGRLGPAPTSRRANRPGPHSASASRRRPRPGRPGSGSTASQRRPGPTITTTFGGVPAGSDRAATLPAPRGAGPQRQPRAGARGVEPSPRRLSDSRARTIHDRRGRRPYQEVIHSAFARSSFRDRAPFTGTPSCGAPPATLTFT